MVGQRRVAAAYAAAGFYLFPSDKPETSGVNLMKAQAMGTFPVTSRHPNSSMPEVCGRYDLGPPVPRGAVAIQSDVQWMDKWVAALVEAAVSAPPSKQMSSDDLLSKVTRHVEGKKEEEAKRAFPELMTCRRCVACNKFAPVAQNEQARAQPTCDETQTVQRDLPDDSWSCRMSTVSTRWPDASSTTSLSPPSDGTRSTTRDVIPTNRSQSAPAAALLSSASACSAAGVK